MRIDNVLASEGSLLDPSVGPSGRRHRRSLSETVFIRWLVLSTSSLPATALPAMTFIHFPSSRPSPPPQRDLDVECRHANATRYATREPSEDCPYPSTT